MSNYQLVNPENPFVFPPDSNISYPIAPMVMAEGIGKTGVLIRATVYINNTFTGTPSFSAWQYNADDKSLTGYVDYNAPEPPAGTIPTDYQAWMVETTYDNNLPVTTIILYLRDTDPKLSRGTVTTVQTSLD